MATGTVVEHWGRGAFLGVYPTGDRVGVFAGGPLDQMDHEASPGRERRLRQRFAGLGRLAEAALEALPDDSAEMFFWRLSDVRSRRWARGRVVLLGDAAAGFLPTAGIGASMAMESAAVLNDELLRTDATRVPEASALYVKRRWRRVLSVQNDSRWLARLMFRTSPPLILARDLLARVAPLEMLAGSIARSLAEPI